MKIYIAARFQDKVKVSDINEQIIKRGHTLAGDWTTHIQTKPYDQHRDISEKYAIEDMEAVLNSDVFILLTNEQPGIGSTTEFGGALALMIKNKKPKVYVVGEHLEGNMFYFYPGVSIRKTIGEVLKEL